MKKKNILIRTDFVIYNTNSIYKDKIVKIPSYIIQDVIEGNKKILIKCNNNNLALYTTAELKNKLVTVESKIYKGKFRQENIEYNLANVKID